ncbi:MAG: nitroreductase family protein [Candidatus Aminicenantes bacterium]|jgi:nitroreductase
MSVYKNIISRRTIRQFKTQSISRDILENCVDTGRLAPSAANLQPLEFIVVDDARITKEVFPCLKWAAYIAPEGNPRPGQEPVAYVIVIVNREIRSQGYEWDVGAAMENMILTAWEEGIGSCWLLSIDRDRLRRILSVPEHYRIDSVLALGYPAEESMVEELTDSVKYWKDDKGRLHVPKRALKDVLHRNVF